MHFAKKSGTSGKEVPLSLGWVTRMGLKPMTCRTGI